MSDRLWKLEGVTLAGRRQPRLDGITLEIRAGITAIIGHSGAGKTSLLNLLVGFERPDGGKIETTLSGNDKRLSLYWVPQTDGLWPQCTVREHLEIVSRRDRDSSAKIDQLLASFDLVDFADRVPEHLSQGERARLAVARALASCARVLVMDEPLVHVDPARVGEYRQMVFDWCARHEISLVLSSHSPEIVLRDAANVICLDRGKLIYHGPVDELYYHPKSRELAEFLGPVNWLSSDEATEWVGAHRNGAICVRPERLQVTPSAEGPFVVESSRFAGSIAEVELRHEPTQERRRFFHRPAGNLLKSGDRVLLRILAVLLCLLVAGCDNEDAVELPVVSSHYWPLPPVGPTLPSPRKLTVGPDDSIYVLDDAGRVIVYDANGKLNRRWNMPESSVGNPEAVIVLRDGRIAVADTHYHRVVFFDSTGKVLRMAGTYGTGPEQYIYPVALAEDDKQNLYVCEYGGNDRVQKYSVDGKYLLQFGKSGVNDGEFQRPSGILWYDHKIYVADAFNNRVQVFNENGQFEEILGSPDNQPSLKYPYDICLTPGKQLMIVEYDACRVSCLDFAGHVLGRAGSSGDGERQFWTPWGLAVNSRGSIFVADTGNHRIVALETSRAQ